MAPNVSCGWGLEEGEAAWHSVGGGQQSSQSWPWPQTSPVDGAREGKGSAYAVSAAAVWRAQASLKRFPPPRSARQASPATRESNETGNGAAPRRRARRHTRIMRRMQASAGTLPCVLPAATHHRHLLQDFGGLGGGPLLLLHARQLPRQPRPLNLDVDLNGQGGWSARMCGLRRPSCHATKQSTGGCSVQQEKGGAWVAEGQRKLAPSGRGMRHCILAALLPAPRPPCGCCPCCSIPTPCTLRCGHIHPHLALCERLQRLDQLDLGLLRPIEVPIYSKCLEAHA